MDEKTFERLERGDMIKHIADHRVFVVTGNYGSRITAVTSVDLTNPSEWKLVESPNQHIHKDVQTKR